MPATMQIELGPCDDIGRLFINGLEVATVNLDEVRRAKREIPDGDYEVRLEVHNPGLWAWRAAVRLRGDGYEILAIDEREAAACTAARCSRESGSWTVANRGRRSHTSVSPAQQPVPRLDR